MKYFCYHAKINCRFSISFHLRNCPCMNNLTLTYTNRQIQCNAACNTCTFYSVLGKAPPASLSTRHSYFGNLPRNPFSLFCSFLPSNIPCRFQSTVPCLINGHQCTASRKLYPRPSQNKVHEGLIVRAIIE